MYKQLLLSFYFLLTLLFPVVATYNVNATVEEDYVSYSKDGISLIYPPSWEIQEPSILESVFIPFGEVVTLKAPGEGNGYENSRIYIYKADYDESLKNYLNEEKEFYEDYEDYELFDIKNIYLSGLPAYELTFFADSVYEREIITIAGKSIYTVEYAGPEGEYDEYYDAATEIINSIKISESSVTTPNALTLEKGCIEVSSLIQKTSQECTDMFSGNEIKSKGALFIGCNIVKLIGGQLHPIAAVVAFFIPC